MIYQTAPQLNTSQKEQLCDLWNREYPVNIRHQRLAGFEAYLAGLQDPCHRLLLAEDGSVCAWLVDFQREGNRWFAMLVAGEYQGMGLGTSLLRKAMEAQNQLQGWVVAGTDYLRQDGSPYHPPLGFYRKMGFSIHHDQVLETDTLETIMVRWAR